MAWDADYEKIAEIMAESGHISLSNARKLIEDAEYEFKANMRANMRLTSLVIKETFPEPAATKKTEPDPGVN